MFTRVIVVREDEYLVFFDLLESLCCKFIAHKLNKRVSLFRNMTNFDESVKSSENFAKRFRFESFGEPLDEKNFVDTAT